MDRVSSNVPAVLGPTRLEFLYDLWKAGYEHGLTVDDRTARGAGQELTKLGYAERNPDSRHHFRITQDGIDRLLAPMRLYRRGHLRRVK